MCYEIMKFVPFIFLMFIYHLVSAQEGQVINHSTQLGVTVSGLYNQVQILAEAPNNGIVSSLGGVVGRYGYSVGFFYKQQYSKQFQVKYTGQYLLTGFDQVSPATGKVGRINFYQYVQLKALIGWRPLRTLTFYTGPVLNLLVGSSGKERNLGNGRWSSTKDFISFHGGQSGNLTKLTVGLHTEAEFVYKQVGIHIAYYKGFNRAAQWIFYRQNPTYNNFYYSSIELGLSYTLNNKRVIKRYLE